MFLQQSVTTSPLVVDKRIGNVLFFYNDKLDKLLVGLASKWVPTMHNNRKKVAIIQLCVGRRILVFQVDNAKQIPRSLVGFLGERTFTFVGKDVKEDALKLAEYYGLHVQNTKDIGYWAACKYENKEFEHMRLAALTLRLFQKEIRRPRKFTMDSWNVKAVTDQQVACVCLDAFVSMKLGLFLYNSLSSFTMPYSTTHDIVYKGHEHIFTTATASASVVDEWIADTLYVYRRKLSKLIIGLDTEWCPPAYPSDYQKSAVLQLCAGRRCLVYQIYHARYFPKSLVDFLGNEQYTFVSKGVRNDKDKLSQDYGLVVGNCKDVGDWAASMGKDKDDRKLLARCGLSRLALELLGEGSGNPKKSL